MPNLLIPVDGGLVTSEESSRLDSGELTRADDCYYKPSDRTLWKVRGRAAFNSSAEASTIQGARFLGFDNTTDKIVAMVGATYRIADAGLTGSFSNLVTGLAGTATTLDSVHYNNEHVLLNGVDRNRVVTSASAASFHGLLANTAAPAVTLSGTGLTLSSGKVIRYWVEERVKAGSTILRRNSDTGSTIATLTGPVTNQKPTITRPDVVNSDATHWALFGTATDTAFPTGFEIGEVAIATTTIDDTRSGTDPGAPSGAAYQVLSVSIGGVTQNVAKNGPPPISASGDIMEDSLVLWDATDKSRLVYSVPDNIHAFPAINFIRFETKEQDEGRVFRMLDRYGIALLRDSAWRVETLPRPEDSSFQIERVKAQIEGAFGVVNALAAATFSFGQGLRLAYVSPYGIIVTDGYSWDVLTDDIEWESVVDIAQLSKAVLQNNPREYRLEFYYTPAGATKNTRALYLHYHPSHAKASPSGSPRAKVTGPINVAAVCAFKANISSLDYIFTGHTDGKVYQENTGTSDPSGAGGISMVVRTGDLYIAGLGRMARIQRYWVHHQAGVVGQRGTVRVVQRAEGVADLDTTASIPLSRREATSAYGDMAGEAFQLGIENADTSGQVGIDYFAVQSEDLGEARQEGEA